MFTNSKDSALEESVLLLAAHSFFWTIVIIQPVLNRFTKAEYGNNRNKAE
ncbi:hypothetical protein QFZ20_003876 [Flavobacterium sp. W4I14]|nr:hypothetical protein [Flavobacterium sp. W4I14]